MGVDNREIVFRFPARCGSFLVQIAPIGCVVQSAYHPSGGETYTRVETALAWCSLPFSAGVNVPGVVRPLVHMLS